MLVTDNTLYFFCLMGGDESKQFYLITAVILLVQCRKAVYQVDGKKILNLIVALGIKNTSLNN